MRTSHERGIAEVTITVESTIKFPYKRSLGPVIGPFMTALAEQRFIAIRSGSRVICPPLEWDPETAAELPRDFVDVGPAGTVCTWSWVSRPTEQHPLDRPFAFALIKLDGADTALTHVVDVESIDQMSTGMRVAPRWRAERLGHITDVEAFVPGEEAITVNGGVPGEPVTMMSYDASITYKIPVSDNTIKAHEATAQGRLVGLKCPVCERIYARDRGFCPIDTVELTDDHEVELPQRGVVTSYTIITPVQYPGQTETEPFSRVMVLIDEIDVVMMYQPLVDVPVEDVRIGMRVAVVWASEAEKADAGRPGNLVGWMPTGEPDNTDPSLANRIM